MEADLAKKLEWALSKLRECGEQLEFTVGMCLSLATAENTLQKFKRNEAAD